ncbi:MAG: hypothetical protein J7K72_05105 [Candidatus Aenigmarchaeota archaeon]|nr:hypothetical protein [Candidatus Aenigmarchaeota archaeon]
MVKFPFWGLGKGAKRNEIDKGIFRKNLESYRFVRDIYCKYYGIDWKSLPRDERVKHAKKLKSVLKNLPNLIRENDDLATYIQERILDNGRPEMTQEALATLDYLMRKSHLLKGPAEVKEPKYVEFIRKREQSSTQHPKNSLYCPNCYNIHGTYYPLVRTDEPDEYYCNSCRVIYKKSGHKLIPIISDRCPRCGGPLRVFATDVAGAHTKRVYSFYCPYHGAPAYSRTDEGIVFTIIAGIQIQLSEQYYREWKENRKVIMKKQLKDLENKLKGELAGKYGLTYDTNTGKFKGKIKGSKIDFRNQLEGINQLIGKASANIDNFGFADISANEIPKDSYGERLVDQSLIKDHGFSDRDSQRFPIEEQEAYQKSQGEISKKVKERRMRREESIDKEPIEEWRVKHRLLDPIRRLSEKSGDKVKGIFFFLVLIILGITISALLGNTGFLLGFLFWAFREILPEPEKIEIVENPTIFFFGSLFATHENRTNTGLAFLRSVLKLAALISFIFGLYSASFPLSNLLLLLLAFGMYFTLPISFDPTKPDEFIESAVRVLLAVFIAVFIFGLKQGTGIFQAPQLGWLTLAFFFVFPVATEKNNVIRALGKIASPTAESYEMIDKLIFIAIMLLFAIVYGFSFVGGFFKGTAGIVFGAVWILGLVAGLTTPAETRPWMGVLILTIGFVIFGMGVGQQSVGVAIFGQWWPTIHNSVAEVIKPIGDLFFQFQKTFGQTWLLFTNPMGFAQQITEGKHIGDEISPAGAYGLEIRKISIPSVYVDEDFMIEIELENKGMYDAELQSVKLVTTFPLINFKFQDKELSLTESDDPILKKELFHVASAESPVYIYSLPIEKKTIIKRQDIVPLFIFGIVSCEDIKKSEWRDFFGGHKHTVKEKYIPMLFLIEYNYKSESSLSIDFISKDEWDRLSKENKLTRKQVQSVLSTSPANLNLGTMDQPLREDFPFFIGFNLTSAEGPRSRIRNPNVRIEIPHDLTRAKNIQCTNLKGTRQPFSTGRTEIFLGSQGFCRFQGMPDVLKGVPKKTYIINASAEYTFVRWERKDTLFNFRDTCIKSLTAEEPGSEEYCADRIARGYTHCDLGMGGCRSDDDCRKDRLCNDKATTPPLPVSLECRDIGATSVCCFGHMSSKDCEKAYDIWKDMRDKGEIDKYADYTPEQFEKLKSDLGLQCQ